MENPQHCGRLALKEGGFLEKRHESWTFLSFLHLIDKHVSPCFAQRFHVISRDFMFCCLTVRGGDGGCAGATGELAFQYISQHGLSDPWLK